jgi:hypothetical protein
MTGDLQQELSVSAFVEHYTVGWPLDRQATKDKRPGGEAQAFLGKSRLTVPDDCLYQ